MKIVLLAGASSIHTVRWANGLHCMGIEVHVISQHPPMELFADGVQVHLIPYRGVLGYFSMIWQVKRLLAQIRPDLVNAHYASGYATTARLVGYRPWLLSVWGSDVYDFPNKSPLHRLLVRKNLLSADAIASTSRCMAYQARTIAPEISQIAITPFGVDMESYEKVLPEKIGVDDGEKPIVIGTVKTMAPQYGIDILIKSFYIVVNELNKENKKLASRLRLMLVGGGEQIVELKSLALSLGIEKETTFAGQVPYPRVPGALAGLDIYVALSRRESFGVAVIEAGAAALPVVVSDVGGLPEVTIDGKTGFVVQKEDPAAAAEAILRLVRDCELRRKMGMEGRRHVMRHYGWTSCMTKMINLYSKTIETYRED